MDFKDNIHNLYPHPITFDDWKDRILHYRVLTFHCTFGDYGDGDYHNHGGSGCNQLNCSSDIMDDVCKSS